MKFFKPYTYKTLIIAGILVLLVSTFNVLIDPYAVFGTPRIAGLNEFKPFAGDRGRVGKLYQVLRLAPKGLIVGNSRPEMGLSPDNVCWPASARPVYNISLPGESVYRQVRYAQHALVAGPVRALVMGVDFLDFLNAGPLPADPGAWPPTYADVDAEPFAVDPDGRPVSGFLWVRLADYIKAAVSLNAFGHSLATLARQSDEVVPTRTTTGFNPAEGIYLPIIRAEGQLVLFEQKDRELAKRLTGAQWRLFAQGETWSPDFEALRRLIRKSRADGAETVLFINPYHAEYLALLDKAGLWPQFEMWKRWLTVLARAEGLPLWDFSGINGYSTESVDALPARGASLEWFWEPAHYRRELGDLILANIWRAYCPQGSADAPRYGVRLDQIGEEAATLEAYLAAQRIARDSYKATHPLVVARVEKLFDPAPK